MSRQLTEHILIWILVAFEPDYARLMSAITERLVNSNGLVPKSVDTQMCICALTKAKVMGLYPPFRLDMEKRCDGMF